jgi:hypothetical protein
MERKKRSEAYVDPSLLFESEPSERSEESYVDPFLLFGETKKSPPSLGQKIWGPGPIMQRLQDYGGPHMLSTLAQVRKPTREQKKIPATFASHVGGVDKCLYLSGEPLIDQNLVHLQHHPSYHNFQQQCREQCLRWSGELLDMLLSMERTKTGVFIQGNRSLKDFRLGFELTFDGPGLRDQARSFQRPLASLEPAGRSDRFYLNRSYDYKIPGTTRSAHYTKDEMIPILCNWLASGQTLVVENKITYGGYFPEIADGRAQIVWRDSKTSKVWVLPLWVTIDEDGEKLTFTVRLPP